MTVLPFQGRAGSKETLASSTPRGGSSKVAAPWQNYSIEVTPKSAAKVAHFGAVMPAGSRVYIAHIEGVAQTDMHATAAKLLADGMQPMPHMPARVLASRQELNDLLTGYRDLGIDQALILGGGRNAPAGPYASSMDLLATGLFDDFSRLHIAGHPEGNRDITPDAEPVPLFDALRAKQAFGAARGIDMAIVTQFGFEAAPLIAWAGGLAERGINLPVHLGVAGPAKLQTLIRYAIACGVGPSLRVLQKRARDVTKLVRPMDPTDLIAAISAQSAATPIEAIHFFPLGGITPTTNWAAQNLLPPAPIRHKGPTP